YFLWSSMPDERLLQLAETGVLLDTNVLRAEIRRMLKNPRARALGERFARQWLDVERLWTEIRPDPARFPDFDGELAGRMSAAGSAYFNHIFQNDLPLLDLIDSDYTLVNERLAALYGLENIEGSDLRVVHVNNPSRGGLLGMAAVHALTSYPLRTSPVLRGRWIIE